jgi:hypothetical protein
MFAFKMKRSSWSCFDGKIRQTIRNALSEGTAADLPTEDHSDC